MLIFWRDKSIAISHKNIYELAGFCDNKFGLNVSELTMYYFESFVDECVNKILSELQWINYRNEARKVIDLGFCGQLIICRFDDNSFFYLNHGNELQLLMHSICDESLPVMITKEGEEKIWTVQKLRNFYWERLAEQYVQHWFGSQSFSSVDYNYQELSLVLRDLIKRRNWRALFSVVYQVLFVAKKSNDERTAMLFNEIKSDMNRFLGLV